MLARHRPVDPLGKNAVLLAERRERLLGSGYRVIRGQAGRDREGADLRLGAGELGGALGGEVADGARLRDPGGQPPLT